MRIGQWQCALSLGKTGIRFAKREGDGATPVCDLRPLRLFLRPDKFALPRSNRFGYRFIRKNQGWCDAPAHQSYNRLVRLPFAHSHEEMWRTDHLYDAVIETDWNFSPRKKGHGSALFIHLRRPDHGPTAGCLAFDPRIMRQILQRLASIRCFRIQPSSRKPIKKPDRLSSDDRK